MNWDVRGFRSKRRTLLGIAGVALLLITGCERTASPPPVDWDPNAENRRYYPLNEGDTWVYDTNMNTTFTYHLVDVTVTDIGMQGTFDVFSESLPHQEVARWSADCLYLARDSTFDEQQILLHQPFQVGTQWRKYDYSDNQSTNFCDAEIISMDDEVDVPAGHYTVMKVREIITRELPHLPASKDTLYSAYAPDVGCVMWNINGIVLELSRYTRGAGNGN